MGVIFLRNRVSGAAPADAYAIGGASPELVAAFTTASNGTTAGEYFRKASSETTFGDLLTFSRSGLATQFDSTGTLCYAPHNFMDGSHNFDNASYWYTADISIAAASTNGPDGSTKMWALTDNNASLLAGMLDVGNVFVSGQNIFEIWITKDEDETRFPRVVFSPFSTQINTKTGAVHHFGSQDDFEITEAIPGLWRCRWTFTRTGATDVFIYPAGGSTLSTSDASATGTTEFGFISIRRADLPMADNPDQPAGLEKYVLTTTAAVYGPRRQAYRYNSGWELAGMQMEAAAATNLHPTSNDFTTWTGTQVTVSVGSTNGPDGVTNSASKVVSGNISAVQYLYKLLSGSGGTDTYSIFAKAGGYNYIWLGAYEGSGSNYSYAIFDLTDGSVVSSGGTNLVASHPGQLASNGFYRIAISATDGGNNYIAVCPLPTSAPTLDAGNRPNITGDGTSGVHVYGAQVEAGTVPSSYIPTSGSTVTRAAETLSIAGADTPFNTTGFTIYEKGLITYADNANAVEATFARIYKDANDSYEWRFSTAGSDTGKYVIRVEEGNVFDTSISLSELTPGVNVPFSAAVRYTSSEVQVALAGTAGTTDATIPAIADMSAIAFTPIYNFNGFLTELRYWGTDLAESGIVEVTS